MNFNQIKETDNQYILNTYKRNDVAFESGKGSKLYDFEGKEYIDFSTGIGALAFGACDDEFVKAVNNQVSKLQHISNLYYTEPQALLAKVLCQKTNMKKVFFANSGAEANEGAIKAARKYSFDKYGENAKRYEIITLKNSFHGRTIATLSATGQDVFHQYFFPFVDGFKHAEVNSIEDLNSLINERTCAIMIETVQGEGGINALDKEYLEFINKICKGKDLVFIIDEVQIGNGRSGYFYSYMEYNLSPDIVTTAKGIAGGLPFGAILFSEKLENTLTYGTHATTFGGNPICAAAAYSIVSRIDDKLLSHVKEASKIIIDTLSKSKEVLNITGKGLMLGVELKTKKAPDVVKKCLDNGLVILTAKTKLRLLPALNIPLEDLEKGLNILMKVLGE